MMASGRPIIPLATCTASNDVLKVILFYVHQMSCWKVKQQLSKASAHAGMRCRQHESKAPTVVFSLVIRRRAATLRQVAVPCCNCCLTKCKDTHDMIDALSSSIYCLPNVCVRCSSTYSDKQHCQACIGSAASLERCLSSIPTSGSGIKCCFCFKCS